MDIFANIRAERKPIALMLRSIVGQQLMELLERKFIYGHLRGATPEDTAFNLGAREVVMELRKLRDNHGQE